jgi:hypothetical protein
MLAAVLDPSLKSPAQSGQLLRGDGILNHQNTIPPKGVILFLSKRVHLIQLQ